MRHLNVLKLLVNRENRETGVTLFEVVLVSVVVGVMAAISVPNLLEEQRRQKVNETFNKIRGALVEAQTNANRLSKNCTVQIYLSRVSGTPAGCVLESFNIDTTIVSIKEGDDFTTATLAPTPPSTPIEKTFSFRGTTVSTGTLWIARENDTTGNTAKCIVISSIGMIRTGAFEGGSCVNLENKRYKP